ncbi:hypothetical protein TURU_147175 [Turdus rufiventris]|nr:hypothetical protein TURU_147175 [Turdus rufiventris]
MRSCKGQISSFVWLSSAGNSDKDAGDKQEGIHESTGRGAVTDIDRQVSTGFREGSLRLALLNSSGYALLELHPAGKVTGFAEEGSVTDAVDKAKVELGSNTEDDVIIMMPWSGYLEQRLDRVKRIKYKTVMIPVSDKLPGGITDSRKSLTLGAVLVDISTVGFSLCLLWVM